MKILFLAPQPFYQERGTPIAVRLLLRALSERGDQVHLLTFPEGEDVDLPGLTVHRIDPWPKVTGVRPGFSLKKVYGDLFLSVEALQMARQIDPDVIHATEESVFLAQALRKILRVPFVYDMDSSMSDQIVDRFPSVQPFRSWMERLEGSAVRAAHTVVPMCDALAQSAQRFGARNILVLRDVSLLGSENGDEKEPISVLRLREDERLRDGKIVLYVGNLEPYQGIDLLLEAFQRAHELDPSARLVVVGGIPAHVEAYTRRAVDLGLEERVVFTGPQPVGHLSALLAQADLLVSPRTQGENTPMKVYTYLDSGVAVLMTDLPTHTQVANREHAGLADPEPRPFGEEMAALLGDDARRRALAAAAKDLIRREHSYESFRRRVHELYGSLEAELAGPEPTS